jgi:hypothetical protein
MEVDLSSDQELYVVLVGSSPDSESPDALRLFV